MTFMASFPISVVSRHARANAFARATVTGSFLSAAASNARASATNARRRILEGVCGTGKYVYAQSGGANAGGIDQSQS